MHGSLLHFDYYFFCENHKIHTKKLIFKYYTDTYIFKSIKKNPKKAYFSYIFGHILDILFLYLSYIFWHILRIFFLYFLGIFSHIFVYFSYIFWAYFPCDRLPGHYCRRSMTKVACSILNRGKDQIFREWLGILKASKVRNNYLGVPILIGCQK